jgi:hypothetical protein
VARLARFEHVAVLDSGDVEEARDDELVVGVRQRANDGGRFDEILSGRAGLSLEGLPVWARHEIARCQRYASVSVEVPRERAQAMIQAAERLLLEWAQAGELTWTVDGVTGGWRAAEAILPRPTFAADDHFVVVVEAVERAPGAGHLVRSRGLTKFALPDVAMRAPRAEAPGVAEWVREVARRGAEGEPFQPGRRILVRGRGFALWPRSEDGLSAAPPDEAPLYELREGGLAVVR